MLQKSTKSTRPKLQNTQNHLCHKNQSSLTETPKLTHNIPHANSSAAAIFFHPTQNVRSSPYPMQPATAYMRPQATSQQVHFLQHCSPQRHTHHVNAARNGMRAPTTASTPSVEVLR